MKHTAAAICLSLASLTTFAQATQKPLDVQVDFLLDKQPIAHFDSVVLKDPFGVVKPFAFRNGDVAAEVVCSTGASGNTTSTSLTSRGKFVGMSIAFQPVSEHDGKVFGHVTVQDTTSAGYHDENGAAGCVSRLVDTTGLNPTSFDVAIAADAETVVAVPARAGGMLQAGEARYVLKFKPVAD